MSDYNLEKDVDEKFPEIWNQLIKEHHATPQEKPVAVMLGGQPGAGKSFGTKQVENRLNGNVLIINGDDYRPFKKGYREIYEKYGKDASKHTGDFSGAMVQKVRDEAIKNRFNIIIEGTFRTSEIPLREIGNFKKNGYEVDAIVCTCPKDVSWNSTVARGDRDLELGNIPRYTPQEHHDLVVQNLPKNADTIFQSGEVRSFEVYSRTGKLFDSQKDKNKLPSEVIGKELHKTPQQQMLETARASGNPELLRMTQQAIASEHLNKRIEQVKAASQSAGKSQPEQQTLKAKESPDKGRER